MQKQALKGLFFNISTCFSPHLAAFLTGEHNLMFFHLPAHSYHQVCHAGKNLPHAPPFAYIMKVYSSGPIAPSLYPTIALLFVGNRSNSFQSLQNWKELHNFVMTFKPQ